MIERLEAEGGYSEDFMSEFYTFRSELRDFFNASSLTDMLAALRPSMDEPDVQVTHSWRFCCKDEVEVARQQCLPRSSNG
jgi:hypothetical protein